MQVKNVSDRPWTINSVMIAPGDTKPVEDPDGVWEASITGSDQFEVTADAAKRGRPAKVGEVIDVAAE